MYGKYFGQQFGVLRLFYFFLEFFLKCFLLEISCWFQWACTVSILQVFKQMRHSRGQGELWGSTKSSVYSWLPIHRTEREPGRERECTAEEKWWCRGRRKPSAGQIVSREISIRDSNQKWEGHCLKAEDLFSSKYPTWAAGRKHRENSFMFM